MAQSVHIGQRIAEARRTAELTQESLAKATGHAPRTVAAWEGGERHPRPEALVAIAAAAFPVLAPEAAALIAGIKAIAALDARLVIVEVEMARRMARRRARR